MSARPRPFPAHLGTSNAPGPLDAEATSKARGIGAGTKRGHSSVAKRVEQVAVATTVMQLLAS